MEEIKIIIKNSKGWNTVNKSNTEKILNNSIVSCNGLYTDDYLRDAEDNYKRDTPEKECINKILRDISQKDYIKVYWDNEKKHFLFFYGHWLNYNAVPKDSLKLIFEEFKTDFKTPESLTLLRDKMQERQNKYINYHYKNLTPEIVSIKERSKYFAVDIGSSGKFLIDKQEFRVYSIKAYGQKGYFLGSVQDIINKIQEDIEQFNKLINGEKPLVYSLNF